MGKHQAFIFGAKEQKAFEELKSLVTSAKALAYFRGECKTSKIADAEPYRLGAVLLQSQEGEWRALRNLAEVERRYAQTEKEPLALVWACQRFNLYVYGRDFALETENKPVECIYRSRSKPAARIERWLLPLQCNNYQVVYRPDKSKIEDVGSRLNQRDPKDSSYEKEVFFPFVA